MDKSSLGDRMKRYEAVTQDVLMIKTPVIIRLDGKAFHTFTKRFKEFDQSLEVGPFSAGMFECMQTTASMLVHYIQGAKVAYSQSDEISILCCDWNSYEAQQWFGGKIQKIVSISAAMASMAFYGRYEQWELIEYLPHRPLFDSRVFNIPREDVVNYFIWRQKDASRNSVNMLGQFHFSHKELQGLKIQDVKDKLWLEKKISWEDLPTWQKRGFCVPAKNTLSSASCVPDHDIPLFTKDRDYIERWLNGYEGEM